LSPSYSLSLFYGHVLPPPTLLLSPPFPRFHSVWYTSLAESTYLEMTAIASHAIHLPSYPGSAGTAGTATLVAFALCAAIIALVLLRAIYARYSRPRDLLSASGNIAVKEKDAHSNARDAKAESGSSLQQLEKAGRNAPTALSWAFFWRRRWTGVTLPLSFHMSETPKPVGTGIGVTTLSQQAKWETLRQSPPYRRATQGRGKTLWLYNVFGQSCSYFWYYFSDDTCDTTTKPKPIRRPTAAISG
jgi:hypothetical protein